VSIGELNLAEFSTDGMDIYYTDAKRSEIWKRNVSTGASDLIVAIDGLVQRMIATKSGPVCLALGEGDRVGVIYRVDVSARKCIPLVDISAAERLK